MPRVQPRPRSPPATPEDHLERCRDAAHDRGGYCFAESYLGSQTPMRWGCAEGHEWLATSASVLSNGTWCGRCSAAARGRRKREVFFAHVIELALERGGECLSREYVHSQRHLRWRCALAHEWEAVPASIAAGTWCPHCASSRPLTIDDLRAMAAEQGGECLSETFVDQKTPLRWRCAQGHEWESQVQQLRYKKRWCPECAFVPTRTLDDARELAARHGGVCLATEPFRTHAALPWRCQMGHDFTQPYKDVAAGHWCPTCRSPGHVDLVRLQRIARRRRGECISAEYLGVHEKLAWRCREGHEWEAVPASIVQGSWCPVCSRYGHSTARLSIEDMQATAAERGGACLSSRYDGVGSPLRWRCARGHEWATTPALVRTGSWCPTCSRAFPGTLAGMRLLAASHGGRCLSTEYSGRRTLVKWQCARGHRFELRGTAAKAGAWCPECTG